MSFGGGSGSSSIAGSTDVVLNSPANNQVLGYNTSLAKWQNQAQAGGGGFVTSILDQGMSAGQNISTTLNALLTSVSAAGGGTIFVPGGLFYAENVQLAANVALNLGPTAILKLPNASTATSILIIPIGANNVTVLGGTLDGNHATYVGAVGRGIFADTPAIAAGLTVRGVKFANFAESGIFLSAGVSKVKVTDCSFTSMGLHAFISYGGADVEVSHNRVDRTGDPIVANSTSIQFYVYSAGNVRGPRMIGNHIIGVAGTGAENALVGISWDVQPGGHCDGGTISGNTIRLGSMGISQAGVTNTVVSGNTIQHSDYTGIEVAGSTGVSVIGNTYDGQGFGAGITVNPTGGAAGVSIVGNTLRDWKDDYGKAGIVVNELTGGTIANNTLSGTYTMAESIYLTNLVESTISGNVIRTANTNMGLRLVAQNPTDCVGDVISGNIIAMTGTNWCNGHIFMHANTGRKIARTLILGNNLKASTGGSYGVEMQGVDVDSIIGTVVHSNIFDSNFSSEVHEVNTVGTVR